jgi:hypothetical protein
MDHAITRGSYLAGQEIETMTTYFSDNLEMIYFTISSSESKLPSGTYPLKLENKNGSLYKKIEFIK